MLIDYHVHLNNYHESDRRPSAENAQQLFDHMAKHGVDHAVVITSYKVNFDRPSTEELIEILATVPRVTLVEGLRWRGESRTDLFTNGRSRTTASLRQRLAAGADGSLHQVPREPGIHA